MDSTQRPKHEDLHVEVAWQYSSEATPSFKRLMSLLLRSPMDIDEDEERKGTGAYKRT